LTGTPIQNRLSDLASLIEFLRVDPFDSPVSFRNAFSDPISTGNQIGWQRLRALVCAISLRRTKSILRTETQLPARQEVRYPVYLNAEERRLYDLVKRRFALAINAGGQKTNAFQLILQLRQICDHGIDLLPKALRNWINAASVFESHAVRQPNFCESCGEVSTGRDDVPPLRLLSCLHLICNSCNQLPQTIEVSPTPKCPVCEPTSFQNGNTRHSSDPAFNDVPTRPSSKVKALLSNLESDQRAAETCGGVQEKRYVDNHTKTTF